MDTHKSREVPLVFFEQKGHLKGKWISLGDPFWCTYLQHSIAITVGKCGFQAAEAGAIILIEIELIVTETWIFHLDFTVTLRYGHKGAVVCFGPWVPREKLGDYAASFFQIVRYLQKRYYLFFFNQSNIFLCFALSFLNVFNSSCTIRRYRANVIWTVKK